MWDLSKTHCRYNIKSIKETYGGGTMTKNHYGKCHICGKEGKLTFEHIPPRKAFNWHGAKVYNGFGALSRSQGEAAKYFNVRCRI